MQQTNMLGLLSFELVSMPSPMSIFKTMFSLWSPVFYKQSRPPSPPRGHPWPCAPSDGTHGASLVTFPRSPWLPGHTHCPGHTLPSPPVCAPDVSTQWSVASAAVPGTASCSSHLCDWLGREQLLQRNIGQVTQEMKDS